MASAGRSCSCDVAGRARRPATACTPVVLRAPYLQPRVLSATAMDDAPARPILENSTCACSVLVSLGGTRTVRKPVGAPRVEPVSLPNACPPLAGSSLSCKTLPRPSNPSPRHPPVSGSSWSSSSTSRRKKPGRACSPACFSRPSSSFPGRGCSGSRAMTPSSPSPWPSSCGWCGRAGSRGTNSRRSACSMSSGSPWRSSRRPGASGRGRIRSSPIPRCSASPCSRASCTPRSGATSSRPGGCWTFA